jgi:hypothetical protein
MVEDDKEPMGNLSETAIVSLDRAISSFTNNTPKCMRSLWHHFSAISSKMSPGSPSRTHE